jgi:hypothetical protein
MSTPILHTARRDPETEESRLRETLAAISRREVFVVARQMAATKHRGSPNWVFAMHLYRLGSTYARAICMEMGLDPDGKTVDFDRRETA